MPTAVYLYEVGVVAVPRRYGGYSNSSVILLALAYRVAIPARKRAQSILIFPKGALFDGVGIKVDNYVVPDPEDFLRRSDRVLERALAILRE